MDKFLESLGVNLTYDQLTTEERAQVHQWHDALKKSELTLSRVLDHIKVMRDSVEQELTKTDTNAKQDVFLKARLKNYMLLEALLTSPEKVKRMIEQEART